MSALDDGKKWTYIKTIPSTHNSGAIRPFDKCQTIPWLWAKCQNKSIINQLNMGIRGFDLRLVYSPEDVYIGHYLLSSLTFGDIMYAFKEFLNNNPSEFIFIFLKPDWATRHKWNYDNIQCFWDDMKEFDDYTKGYDNTIFIDPNIDITNVIIKNIRGKVILIPDGRLSQYINPSINVGVGSLSMNIFNVCETWNKNTLNKAKDTIIHFINTYCKMNNKVRDCIKRGGCVKDNGCGVKEHDEIKEEDNIHEDMKNNYNLFNNKIYNIIQLNVVMPALPPYFVSVYMNKWFMKEWFMNAMNTHLGFVSVDFANIKFMKQLIALNYSLCIFQPLRKNPLQK